MPKDKINLLPQEDFEKKPLGKFLLWALSAGRWIVILTELVVITAFISRFKFDRDLTDLHDKIKQKQAIVQSYSAFEEEFRFFKTRIAQIKTLYSKQIDSAAVLNTVALNMPNDVLLSQFSFEGTSLSISGVALSEEGLGNFLAGLITSKKFTDIDVSSITRKRDEAGIRFSFTAVWKEGEKENAI
jgi:Tfp pilus assembly protein PilN